MAMMVERGREGQTCLLTHNVRSEMQMAKLAATPPASGCQDWCRRAENVPCPSASLFSMEVQFPIIFLPGAH